MIFFSSLAEAATKINRFHPRMMLTRFSVFTFNCDAKKKMKKVWRNFALGKFFRSRENFSWRNCFPRFFFKNIYKHANIQISLSVDWISSRREKWNFLAELPELPIWQPARSFPSCNMSHELLLLPSSPIVCNRDMRGWRICIHKIFLPRRVAVRAAIKAKGHREAINSEQGKLG